jgi:hypothetical protein
VVLTSMHGFGIEPWTVSANIKHNSTSRETCYYPPSSTKMLTLENVKHFPIWYGQPSGLHSTLLFLYWFTRCIPVHNLAFL